MRINNIDKTNLNFGMQVVKLENLEYLVPEGKPIEAELERLTVDHFDPLINDMKQVEPQDALISLIYKRNKQGALSIVVRWLHNSKVAVTRPFPSIDNGIVLEAGKELGQRIIETTAHVLKQTKKLN